MNDGMRKPFTRRVLACVVLLLIGGFRVGDSTAQALRLEISQSERELYGFLDDDIIDQPCFHRKAVASDACRNVFDPSGGLEPRLDTTGERLVLGSYKKPGDADNPTERVPDFHRAPNIVHGTEDLVSLGEAASRGSVRLSNQDVMELARIF
jgi:hypothetical protein